MSSNHPIVEALQLLLRNRADLKSALETAIKQAALPDYFTDLQTFLGFIGRLVRQVPKNSDAMLEMDLAYYYVVSISPDRILMKDREFQAWNDDFHKAWGEFLNTDASVGHIHTYTDDPKFTMDDYQPGPSGWHSFNQFFARQTKPGRRPVAGHCDIDTVVSPCDSVIAAMDTISDDSTITAKGATFKIAELLSDSEYKDAFSGGMLLSAFLQLWNYHRFHTPVAGKVVEAKKIPGHVGMTVVKHKGLLSPTPEPGFQFTQDRGLMVLDTPAMGLVALLPIGMAQISSVVLTAEIGVELYKGEEFGYFQFGGSNIIMLTQKDRFAPDQTLGGKPIHQGQAIGKGLPAAG